MIGLCTDSSSQLTPELLERFGALAVPVTVGFDGHDYLEGVDLDVDGFYDRLRANGTPTITISEPSSGQFALAYEELAERGCDEILSIHSGLPPLGGVVNAARLAAHKSSASIRLVEAGQGGFGTGCCLWAAADAIAAGARLDEVAELADRIGPLVGHVFTVATLELVGDAGDPSTERPVLTMRDGRLEPIGVAGTAEQAVEVMAAAVLGSGQRVKVAVGMADRAGAALPDALAVRLAAEPSVLEVVRFRLGPSVGARGGPGATAVFSFPVPSG